MKSLLFLLNVLLTVAALYLTARALQTEAPPRVPPGAEANTMALVTPPPEGGMKVLPTLGEDVVEAIWKRNLFHPDRTLAEPGDATAEAETEPVAEEQFELVGIARLGERACACIVVHPPRTAPRARTLVRSHTTGRSIPASRPQPKAKQENQPHVYRLGAKVGETGYELTTIDLTSVVLRRESDGSEVTLTMDKNDENSAARWKEAQQTVAVAQQKAAAAAAKVAAAARAQKTEVAAATAKPKGAVLPPPPPPPPLSGVAGSGTPRTPTTATSAKAQSTAERLNELREKRLEYLRQLQQRRDSTKKSTP